MPGKLCAGVDQLRTPLPRHSFAFCDGRLANKNGELQTANPYPNDPADGDYVLYASWDKGWLHYAATPNELGCCAE